MIVHLYDLRKKKDIEVSTHLQHNIQSSIDDGAWELAVRNTKARVISKVVDLARISIVLALINFVSIILVTTRTTLGRTWTYRKLTVLKAWASPESLFVHRLALPSNIADEAVHVAGGWGVAVAHGTCYGSFWVVRASLAFLSLEIRSCYAMFGTNAI